MLYSLHGQTKDAFTKNEGTSWEYDIVDACYKCNMTDIQAALGIAQLDRYDDMLNRRHSLIKRYNEAFKNLPVEVLNHCDDTQRSSAHLYFVRFIGKDADYRNAFYDKMKEKGVMCNVHYKPLPMLTAYKTKGFDIKDFPNAYNQHCNQLTLPLNTVITDEEADYVINSFIETIKELG